MRSYPHAIDDGGGERVAFLVGRRDDHGDVSDVLDLVTPGAGPPMHVRHRR